jgi:hypothetical protein
MKISELIGHLERLKAEHGDLPVMYWDAEYDGVDNDVDEVGFVPEVINEGVTKFIRDGIPGETPWRVRHEARIVIR